MMILNAIIYQKTVSWKAIENFVCKTPMPVVSRKIENRKSTLKKPIFLKIKDVDVNNVKFGGKDVEWFLNGILRKEIHVKTQKVEKTYINNNRQGLTILHLNIDAKLLTDKLQNFIDRYKLSYGISTSSSFSPPSLTCKAQIAHIGVELDYIIVD